MLSIQRTIVTICTRLALCLVVALANAHAQDLEPRAYANTPVGLNFLVAGYAYSDGGLSTDPALPVEEANLRINSALVAYARSLEAWGRPGKVDVVLPWSDLSGTALVDGESVDREVHGLGDVRLRFSLLLHGAPVLTMQEFAGYQQKTIIGTSVQVSVPVGQYDSTRAVNLGTHRWSVKPELGLSRAFGPLILEMAGGVTLYGRNDDYFGGRELEQDPVWSARANLIYTFGRGVWGSLDGTYYSGGQTTIDGVEGDNRLKNSRIGATLTLPINRRNSLKLYASTGVAVRTGSDFDAAGVAWQYRWGEGL